MEDERFAEIRYDERYKQARSSLSGFGNKKSNQNKAKRQAVDESEGLDQQKLSKKKKPEADDRFKKDAKEFEDKFVQDKYGGVKKNKYNIAKEMMGDDESEEVQDEDSEEPETQTSKKQKPGKGQEGRFEWNEESSEEDIDMDKVNELLGNDLDGEVDAWTDDEDNKAPVTEASSKRLALMNYDWSKIHAGDLMIAFSSFLPEGGILKKVSVYPSEFGLNKLKQEELEGPGDIFKDDIGDGENDDTDHTVRASKKKINKHEEKKQKQKRETMNQEWAVSNEDPDSGLDLVKLRKYERDRLKYYYAVLDLDSAKTADALYESCNGFELEKTGIKIGSSFV